MSILDQFNMTGNVAIITGAAAGIGLGIAKVFAEAGCAVVVSDLRAEKAEAAAAAICANGGKAIGMGCNVTNEAERLALVERTIAHFGKLTCLVNNAGGGGPKPFDMSMAEFEWAYQLNVFAPFHLMQLCTPHIGNAGGGAMLNISSMAAENKNSRMASYASSKAAISHLTRNTAFDLGHLNIRVNAIAPGAIRTDALATVLTPDIERNMLKNTPIKRLGEPQDIGMAALFLCSPASAWISGQVLTVSGGGLQELD
ncbi:MAG: 7-alpha-hydroxysteroid dehydrogenase [Shewanella sp.]